jgi:predicted HNH restriction endonuclease
LKVDIINKIETYLPTFVLKNNVPSNIEIEIPNQAVSTEVEFFESSKTLTVFVDDPRRIDEIDEELLERILNAGDSDADYKLTATFAKVRQLNRGIIKGLKIYYGGNCQICGDNLGSQYGVDLSEAHHIEYFSISMNNKPDNLIVLCPNHHRLIHKTNPTFDKGEKMFVFPNGCLVKLMLNKHL